MEPQEIEHLQHVPRPLIVVHLNQLLVSDQRAHDLLLEGVKVVIGNRSRGQEVPLGEDREYFVAPAVIGPEPLLVREHRLYRLLLVEREDEARPHACPLLAEELLEVEDLSIPVCAAESPALYKVREVRGLGQPVDKAGALPGVLLEAELVKVEAVAGAGDLSWLLARVPQVLGVADHDAAGELEEGVSDLEVVEEVLLLGVVDAGMVKGEVDLLEHRRVRYLRLLDQVLAGLV